MRYLLLIYEPADTDASEVPPEQWQQTMDEYNRFTEEVRRRGVMEGGEALQRTTTATTVRIRDGKTLVTDGPFAETKEFLGGFYLLNCRDLDEAIELAAKVPSARWGSVEIRPIAELSDVQQQFEGAQQAQATRA
ncbi:MAG: YciI family protein [Chloroflexota bacterium]|nr:YciI family protein [Chloroflexota bacterium]